MLELIFQWRKLPPIFCCRSSSIANVLTSDLTNAWVANVCFCKFVLSITKFSCSKWLFKTHTDRMLPFAVFFRWGRWSDILAHGRFKRPLKEIDVETICRALLAYCLLHYRGDENIKSFIWDLITPSEDGTTKTLTNHSGNIKRLYPIIPIGTADTVWVYYKGSWSAPVRHVKSQNYWIYGNLKIIDQ